MVNDVEEQQLKARAEKIRVAVRCCPGRACHASISHNRTSFTMQRPKTTLKKQLGDFEKIFDEEDGGVLCEEFFSPATKAAVEKGEDTLLVAFGAKNTGKTTTMRQAMLQIRSDVFAGVEKLKKQGEEVMVSISAVMSAVTAPVESHLTGRQVAHEVLLDCLLPQGLDTHYKGGLHVREDPNSGFFVEGLTEVCVENEHELLKYMDVASKNFDAEEQRCGKGGGAPLRVHRLVTLKVWRKHCDMHSCSHVQILDLAGWQRPEATATSKGPGGISRAGKGLAFEDMVVKATMRIIDSLHQGMSHIPYRDSKLTRLLKKGLGGSSNCLFAMHVSLDSYEETEAMLQLAHRVSSICNNVVSSRFQAPNLKDRHAGRIEELCRLLGKSSDSLLSSSMSLHMGSSDEEVELRSLVSEAERLCKQAEKWQLTLERSDAFKAGGIINPHARLDRKPPRATISEVGDSREDETSSSAPRLSISGVPSPVEERGDHDDGRGDVSIASKLAELQKRRAGNTRLRAMS